MALPSSGQIAFSQVNTELGRSATQQLSLSDASVRSLFGIASGQISMSNGYGKSMGFSATLTIASNVNDYNIKSAAIGAGWNQTVPASITVVVNSGVVVGASSTGAYAMNTDSGWVAGSVIYLTNNGTIAGAGGRGGNGGLAAAGAAGSGGGPAMLVSNATRITNNGTIAGGGGGGGGGGGATVAVYGGTAQYGGGGGGGGRGSISSAGGTQGTGGTAGGAGSISGPGGGGAGLTSAGAGGSGGGFGSGGSPGGAGFSAGTNYAGGGGGSAGYAVVGIGNVTWITAGTVLGLTG